MKILHVIAQMDPATGGVSQAVRTMIGSLNSLDCFNTVVSLDNPKASFVADAPFHLVALGPGKGPWCYHPALIPWLKANIIHYDLIIGHGLWLFPIYAIRKSLLIHKQTTAGTILQGKGPQSFIMPHGMLDPYFQSAKQRKLKAIRNMLYWRFIEEKDVRHVNGLLFTCEQEKLLARNTFACYRPRKERVVGLGVERPPTRVPLMEVEFRNKCADRIRRTYILYLGRINEKKGLRMLVEAYRRLFDNGQAWKQGIESIPQLVIAGPGFNSRYGEEILHTIAGSPWLKEQVVCCDMLTGNVKWGAFYGCEAFILPSHQENFGIAIVEALACGRPVMISNKVNIWREIEQSGAGIVQDDSVQGTYEMLQQWMNLDAEPRKEMSQKAVEAYNTYYSLEPAARKIIEVAQEDF